MDKEIKITPPEGYEIDKENSTFDCIKFKLKKKWCRYKPNIIDGYYIDENSSIKYIYQTVNSNIHYNIFATEKQAKSALAMARISQIMANDKRFGGVVTDEEWGNDDIYKYVIFRNYNTVDATVYFISYVFLAFHTKEQRDLFLKENEDLIRDYFMID